MHVIKFDNVTERRSVESQAPGLHKHQRTRTDARSWRHLGIIYPAHYATDSHFVKSEVAFNLEVPLATVPKYHNLTKHRHLCPLTT